MKDAKTLADAPNLTPADAFDLEQAYVDTVESTPRDNRQGVFHPSAVGMCGRRNVYEYIGAPRNSCLDIDDLEIFGLGHAVHALVQNHMVEAVTYLKTKGIRLEFRSELGGNKATDTLYNDFGIGGSCDGLIELFGTGKDFWVQRGILEIKTIKNDGYMKLTGPKPDHLMQATMYAYRFDAPLIWFWYYNKDNSKRRVYTEVFNPRVLNIALNRYAGWMDHVRAGTLPEREESWWACPRCEYKDVCQPSSLTTANSSAVTQARGRATLRRVK